MKDKFELYRDVVGEWRWRFRAANGKIIADSAEGYRDKNDALLAMGLIRLSAPDAPMIELKDPPVD